MNNLLKFKRDFKSYKSYFIHTLLPIVVYGCIIGLFTGAVVWAYTVAAEWLSEHTVEIYTFVRENPAFIPLLFLSLGALGFLAWLNVKITPEACGSGIPYVEGVMRGLLPLRWLRSAVSMIVGSFISFFAGLPLGCEGPSVFVGGCIGKGANEIGSNRFSSRYAWRRQSVTGGAAAGFAVAFNAPLAGIVFALEEGHKRFSPMILLPAAASAIVATVTSNVLTHLTGHGITNVIFTEFTSEISPTFREIGYFIILGVVTGLTAGLFSFMINKLNELNRKLKIPRLVKFIAAFLITGIIGLSAADAIGGGSMLIRKIATLQYPWKLLLALFAIKLFQLVICSSSEVTGGYTIPVIALGALLGGLMANLFIYIGMDEKYYNLVVLISMCALLGAVVRAPIMAIILVVEMTKVTVHLWAACLVIIMAYFIIELFHIDAIFDNSLGNILANHYRGKRKKLVELEIEIEAGSFAVNRSVRDILWPANTLVIKVEKTDENGNIIYGMDEDGERKIHVGDKFIIQAETSDFDETYRQLCYIVKRPGFNEMMESAYHADKN